MFLAPAGQLDAARTALPDGSPMRVLGVATFDDARAALAMLDDARAALAS